MITSFFFMRSQRNNNRKQALKKLWKGYDDSKWKEDRLKATTREIDRRTIEEQLRELEGEYYNDDSNN